MTEKTDREVYSRKSQDEETYSRKSQDEETYRRTGRIKKHITEKGRMMRHMTEKSRIGLSTLCYMERDGKYLMLHRTVKKNDVNKDKWIGVGGHFEADESPEECLLREVREETGYTLSAWKYRGIVTFVSGNGVTEYMSLFTSDAFTGEPIDCDEGELEWVDIEQVWKLNIWEGDKIFFRLLDENHPFFSLKLVYDGHDRLVDAVLDGKPMELFDILNEDGSKSGLIRERGVAHREGSLHATAHIWIVRPNEKSGYDVMLQKRSQKKDSNPGCYDISSAGHISSGDEVLPSALRELSEELGIQAKPDELYYVGVDQKRSEGVFYGKPFRDYERSYVYLYREPVKICNLVLQESEVESVIWMDYEECRQALLGGTIQNCIGIREFEMIGTCLGIL